MSRLPTDPNLVSGRRKGCTTIACGRGPTPFEHRAFAARLRRGLIVGPPCSDVTAEQIRERL
jgi:hypothetical protein